MQTWQVLAELVTRCVHCHNVIIIVTDVCRHLYWSVLGSGGGIFKLDLAMANSGSCSNSTNDTVNIVSDVAAEMGVKSITLNLEDSLLYFAIGESSLLSINLGGEIVNYSHQALPSVLDARSIASYNEYLAVTVNNPLGFGLFVRIRRQIEGISGLLLIQEGDGTVTPDHLYMIREEFQPQPGVH